MITGPRRVGVREDDRLVPVPRLDFEAARKPRREFVPPDSRGDLRSHPEIDVLRGFIGRRDARRRGA